MSDLIRREDAIKAVSKVDDYGDGIGFEVRSHCLVELELVPSADRPQGEWIEKNNGYDTTCECSVCHYRNFIPNYQVGSKYVCMDRYWFKRNFCPSCGARMKGADDE